MTALYRLWSRRLDLPAVAASLLRHLGISEGPPAAACRALAAAVSAWGGHPYHSAAHHAEVAANAAVLLALDPAPPPGRALLLAACLAHDYASPPAGTPHPRFATEQRSAAAADAVAASVGLPPADRAGLRALILATEPGFRAALRGDAPGDVPEELRALLQRPALAAVASVLSDADLLSSAGLGLPWHRRQHARLEAELGRPLAPAEDLRFLDGIVGPGFLSPGGRRFTPNLLRLRAHVAAQAAA